jgi:hypothetical protein
MTQAAIPDPSEPIEDYLDQLLLQLSGTPRQVRLTLAEAEAHLYDALAAELAGGRSQAEAEAVALVRFGPVRTLTGRGVRAGRPAAALVRRTVLAGSLVGGVALVAVGVAGAIAWLFARIGGARFVTAPFPLGSYTHADCARWLAGDTATHSCVTAMLADHVGDIVLQSSAAGVAGVGLLATFGWLRRRWHDRGTLTALPIGSAEAAGAALAGIVTAGTLALGIDAELVQAGQGAGQLFSLAIAAAGAAAYFSVRLYLAVRPRPVTA